ncbi:MAG: hypothetical protein WC763_05570 [Candidatus Paceibacterota bacterium]|jgi:hypothetical protein
MEVIKTTAADNSGNGGATPSAIAVRDKFIKLSLSSLSTVEPSTMRCQSTCDGDGENVTIRTADEKPASGGESQKAIHARIKREGSKALSRQRCQRNLPKPTLLLFSLPTIAPIDETFASPRRNDK